MRWRWNKTLVVPCWPSTMSPRLTEDVVMLLMSSFVSGVRDELAYEWRWQSWEEVVKILQ